MSTVDQNLNASYKVTLYLYRTLLSVLIIIVGFVGFWYLEPDPLTVEYVPSSTTWSKCTARQYNFERVVKSSKDVLIVVQERWYDLDNMNVNDDGLEHEIVVSKTISYPLGEGFEKVMSFNKEVPISVGIGRWEYRPYATYQVNPFKSITKPLPSQKIEVVCDYDPAKHRGATVIMDDPLVEIVITLAATIVITVTCYLIFNWMIG